MSTGTAEGYFEFFPDELIPAGLQLTLDAWRKLSASDKTGKEDKITGRLAAVMKREKKARQLSFSIHFQVVPLDLDKPAAARIDFKFLAGFDEDAYFAFECKRVRIPRSTKLDHNTSSYVQAEGMERFIIGKYSATQNHGAMVGYVMDGNVVAVKPVILAAIQARKKKLKLISGDDWEDSQFLPSEPNIRQTRHRRKLSGGNERDFALQHIFLAV